MTASSSKSSSSQKATSALSALRDQIDDIDNALLTLLAKRQGLSRQIATKKALGSNVFRPDREMSLLRNLIAAHHTIDPRLIMGLWRHIISASISEQKPESSQEVESEEGDNLNFEDAREGGNDESFGDSDEVEDEQLMVIETPEGLTLVEPTDNSSFYIVQEHEGHETPLGTFNIHGVIQVFQRLQIFPF